MGAVNNPHFYSTMSGTTTTTQITDATDFPHSGLIKSLSQGIRGNYAIQGSATDFDITFADGGSFTTIAVAEGKAFRDGKLVTVSALTATNMNTAYNPGTGAVDITPVSDDLYLLLVAKSDNTMVLRGVNSNVNKVPDFVDGDIPIALIKIAGGSADDSVNTSERQVQYLTTSKVSNDLSIGYDSSGYTEMSKISAASGGTTIEVPTAGGDFIIDNTDADKKIVARLGSDDANTAFEVRNNSDAAKLSVTGAGVTTVTGSLSTTTTATIGTDLTVSGGDINYGNGQDSTLKVAATTSTTAGRDLTIEAGSTSTGSNNINGGDLILKSGGGDGTGTSIMTFSTKVSGTDTVAERMRIHTDGKVGIGTNSPDNLLEVQNSDATTNAIVYPFKLSETTSGTATHGIGVGMKFEVENAAGTQKETGYITSSLATATNAAEMGQMDLQVGKKHPSGSYAINPAITMQGKYPAHVATRETWGIAYQWGNSDMLKVLGGGNPGSGGTPGSIYPQKLTLLDTSTSGGTYFQLWALPTGTIPSTSEPYSIPHGFTMTIKNIGHQTATIYTGHVQEHIDFGQTSNAFISSANVISLPAMAAITLMAYGDDSDSQIKLQEILDGYDTNNYAGYDEGAATGEGWLVISQTG